MIKVKRTFFHITCAISAIVVLLGGQPGVANENRYTFGNQTDTIDKHLSISAATAMVKSHMRNLSIPGMQVAVSLEGNLVWSASFGYADIENELPVTAQTSFRIGSVSKTLTGAAIALLLQQKKIKLNASINDYLPSFPKKPWPISIADLVGYTSGIRHYHSDKESNSTTHYATVTESLRQFANDPLLFEPGTDVAYSSFGYVLLSAVVESASRQSFPQYMQQQIFDPLGMTHSSMDYGDKEVPFRSKFYIMNDSDQRVEAPFVNNSNKWAAGGMISTAEDLVKFGTALLGEAFLKQDIVRKIFTSLKTKNGKETGFGIGWNILRDANDRRVILMDGSLPSARSVLLIYPDEKLVMSVLANTGTSILFNKEEALMLADLFLNPKGLNPFLQEKKEVIGSYNYSTFFDEDSITGKITIIEKDGKLEGTMTIPNRFFKNRIISVPVISVVGNEVHLLGLPGNWISLRFQKNTNNIKGHWRFGPLKGELMGSREL